MAQPVIELARRFVGGLSAGPEEFDPPLDQGGSRRSLA